MHFKNQPARHLSHSMLYLQRGFQGSARVPSPGLCPPCRGAGKSPAGGRRGALPAAPEGSGGPRGSGAAPLAREAFAGGAGRGVPALRPLIAPGRSVGAAASRASPAPSRCWARGSRRRGGTALVPPPGRDGPRCWRGSPGWTGRCSGRRRSLRRAEHGDTAARYRGCRAASPVRGERGCPAPPLPPARRARLTVGHLRAVDGLEAAASRRPNGAATVGLQDSEGRVPTLPPPPRGQRDAPREGKGP